MGRSKIVFGDETLIDLTGDTVVADKLFLGYTTHGPDGEPLVGTHTEFNVKGLMERTITEVVIPSDVTYLGDAIFMGCDNLENVTFHDNITKIDECAFYDCLNLTIDSLPANLEYIGYAAFSGSGVYFTTLPSSVTVIESGAFYGCENLGLVSLPTNLEYIYYESFGECPNLAITEIPVSVKGIGSGAFYQCTGLTEITFLGKPEEGIYEDAFEGCTNIQTITCPWYEGEVEGAPWGAVNATVVYLQNETVRTLNVSYADNAKGRCTLSCTYSDGSTVESGTNAYHPTQGKTLTFYLNCNSMNSNERAYIEMTMNGEVFDIEQYRQIVSGAEGTSFYRLKYENIPVNGDGEISVKINTAANTYTVTDVDDATYGFALNSNNYYESQNKGVNNSAALAKINLELTEECEVTITFINYAEANYDFGMFSKLDTELSTGYSADSTTLLQNEVAFKSSTYHKATEQTVTYTVPAGEHFIVAKFIKDVSQASNNDSLQFKVNITPTGASATMYSVTINSNESYLSHGTVPSSVEDGNVLTTNTTVRWTANDGYKITGATITIGGSSVDLSTKTTLLTDGSVIQIETGSIAVTGDVVITIHTEPISSTPTTNSYTVETESGVTYGFSDNGAGYYVSQNTSSDTFAMSRINLSLSEEKSVKVSIEVTGEDWMEIGYLSSLNGSLLKSIGFDNGANLEAENGVGEVSATYTVPTGNSYILAKFINLSGASNAKMKFKVEIL